MIEAAGQSLAPLLLGGTLLAVAAGMILTVHAQRRRTQAARAWAQARGWTYQQQCPDLHKRYTGPPFGRGHSRLDEHVLSGSHASRSVTCFDYRYVTTSGSGARGDRHDDTNRHVVIVTELAPRDPRGPALDIAPRRPARATSAAAGTAVEDIDAAAVEVGAGEFDQAFAVSCTDAGHARAMLGPQTRSLLLQRPTHRWRLDARHLLLVRDGEGDLGSLDGDLDLAAAMLDSLPRTR